MDGIIVFISSLRVSYLSFLKSPNLKKNSCYCYSMRKMVNVSFLTCFCASLLSYDKILSTSFSSCHGSLRKKSLNLMNLKDFFSFFSSCITSYIPLSVSSEIRAIIFPTNIKKCTNDPCDRKVCIHRLVEAP